VEQESSDRYTRARSLVQRAAPPGSRIGLAGALDRVCAAASTELGLSGAAVHLMAGVDHEGVAADSSPVAGEWGEVAFTAGEGPCFDAWRTRRPVVVPDLAAQAARWPGYAAVLLERGVRCVLACPLSVGTVGFGVLDGYGAERGHVEADAVEMLTAFARVATDVLMDGRGVDGSGALELSATLDHRVEIHQAQGMVMVVLQVTLVEALVRMRAHAFSTDVPLLALARDVVAGRMDPRAWLP
jgi:hypothetical protein